ncbi:hypothetical protein [Mycolicibacterium pallens]|uniref:Uncharacterized protein n=1 Tax=Mycolicibacterium pallens TaxID=370524 RepID=A0ABX8VJ93_9MYCO|nr:hypothetical protein [Mycolicibacterium pallens]QYL15845.1 hypothetical protein K0O64_22665 [Mycolicibacterium pallens]
MGDRRNAVRIPLAGLAATVTETGSSGDPGTHRVRVEIDGIPGRSLHRDQPYSYGSIGAARTFEILLNRAAHPTHNAVADPAWRTAA